MKREEIVITETEAKIQRNIIRRLAKRLAGKKRYYYIHTFGCQMNVHDSEKLRGILEEIGYQPASDERQADFVAYNTCAIRENAELKVYGKVGHLKTLKKENPDMVIALCGCMMQQQTVVNRIKKSYAHVDLIFGTHNVYKLAELLEVYLDTGRPVIDIWPAAKEIVEDLPAVRDFSFKASVNIMYGCNNYCTFCIVPHVRGRERSRPSKDIVTEIEALVTDGVKEVMLLGQNVNSYGRGLDEVISFTGLLEKIDQIDGLERVRFMTSHPKDLSDELITFMGKTKRICPQFHLPLQSGSDRLLKRMNRRYTKQHYLELVTKLRRACPQIAISTDIIVGFPGETEADFLETMDVVEQVGYDLAYTFIYSPRIGTPAANMTEQVPAEVSQQRLQRLMQAVNQKAAKRHQEMIGHQARVLVENYDLKHEGIVSGRLANGHLVHIEGPAEWIGQLIDIEITGGRSFYLTGRPLMTKRTAI